MKFLKAASVAALALVAAPAIADGPVAAGATVVGPEGNLVGTIESVADGQAVLDTGKHKVPLPLEAFGQGDGKLTITVTKVQLDGMMDEQLAAAAANRDAALIVGASVVSADAHPVGTLLTIDDANDAIVVQRDGGVISFKREHFALDGNGALMALFTLSQIDANTVEVPEGAQIVSRADAATDAAAE